MADQQCTATLEYDNGDTEEVTDDASWESSDTDVAEVSSSGLVTSVGEGECEVTASYSGLTGTAEVTVTEADAEPDSLSISPSTIELEHEEED